MTSMAGASDAEILQAARIVEGVVGNAWATDPHGRFIYVTPAALDYLDLTLATLNEPPDGASFGWKHVIHPDDYLAAAAAWRHALQTGERYVCEHRMLRPTGSYVWSKSSGQPLRDGSARIIGWYGTVLDGNAAGDVVRPANGTSAPRTNTAPDMALVHPHDRSSVDQASARAFFHGVPQVTSYRQRQPDGSYRWTELRIEPPYGASVEPGVAVAMQDQPWTTAPSIGETAEAVRAARIIENLYGGAWALDARGLFTYATPTTQTSIGMTLDDLNRSTGGADFIDGGEQGWKRTVHPDDYEQMATEFRHGLRTGTAWNVEYRILRANGDYVWHRVGARPTHDSQGRLTGWYGISLDIDVYKRTEAALRERERELSQLVNMVPSHLWCLTAEGEPTFLNQRMIDYLGMTLEDFGPSGRARLDALIAAAHPEDAPALRDALMHSLMSGEPFSLRYRLRRADGVYRWMSSRAEPLRDQAGNIVQWYALCHDIDDQMKAEQALQRSERELSQLVYMIPSHVWRLDQRGEPNFFNRRMIDFIGLDVDDLDRPNDGRLSELIGVIVHPDDVERVSAALRDSLANGETFSLNCRLRRSDGQYRWMSSRAEPLRDEAGHIVQWYGLSHDIDDQIRAEESIRLGKRELQHLIDTVPVQIWCVTPGGEPAYINKTMANYIGLKLGDFEAEGGLPSAIDKIVHPEDREALFGALSHSFATGEPFELKFRNLRWDGTYRWTEGRAEPLRDETGRIIRWYGANVDIDDMVATELALRRREGELSHLINMVPSYLWRLTAGGKPNFFNRRLAEFLGYDVSDADQPQTDRLAGLIENSVHSDDAAKVSAAFEHSIAAGERFSMKFRLRRADGVYRWMDAGADPLRDERGDIVQWFGFCHDIDEQTRLYSDVAEREARIRRLVDSDIIGIVIWDLDGTLIDANDAFLKMVRYDREDVERGINWFDMTPPDWQEVHAQEEAEELARTGKMLAREKEYFRKDGTRVPVLIGAACFEGQSQRGVAYILDLTERKRAEEALHQSKQQLEQMIDTLPINILSFAPSGRLTYASRRYHDTVGAPRVEDFEALAREIAHPEDLPVMLRRALSGFATGEPFVNRFRRLCSDGLYRWIEARAQALRDPAGAIVQWYIVSIDIEDEMRAQEALRERERFLWQLVETLPAMIDCAAPNGEPVYRSQQLREFLGYNLEELDGTGKSRLAGTLEAGVHPDDLAGVKERYAQSLTTGEPYARRHRLRRFDGVYRWVETRAGPMRDAAGTIVQWNVICLDIDSEVHAEEALRLARERLSRASQAASLAELSASIAHEVNQPLAAIIANSHACHRWLTGTPPNIERAVTTAERIIRDANRAADIVSRIRALFRQSSVVRHPTAFDGFIREACNLMSEEAMRSRIRIDIEVDAGLPPVALDRVQLQQVVINLIRNAIEAMETVDGKRALGIRARRVGEQVYTEISDLGPGLADPEKVFEPFYTTKSSGMGMGLAICRSIVEAHGGRLWVEPNTPIGAKFVFVLPVEPVPASTEQRQESHVGGGPDDGYSSNGPTPNPQSKPA